MMPGAAPDRLWLVSREYAGLAEAGGVKNVARSLCEGLAGQGTEVTLLIPRYGCMDFSAISGYVPDVIPPQRISLAGSRYVVSFDRCQVDGVSVVLVLHQLYSDKSGVYTYTDADVGEDPSKKRGTGFQDALLMDILFQKAVLTYGQVSGQLPRIVHCQDAATAMIPAMARCLEPFSSTYKDVSFVVTIHNAGPGYHHELESMQQAVDYTSLPEGVLEDCMNGGRVEPFLAGGKFSVLTTVSPWYAQELLDASNRETDGLSQLFLQKGMAITGITNGIDCRRYDPSCRDSSLLPFAFNPAEGEFEGKYLCRQHLLREYVHADTSESPVGFARFGGIQDQDQAVYFCYHGRIASQKGIDVLAEAAALLLEKRQNVRFLLAGQGEPELENCLAQLALSHPGRCVYLRGYDRAMTRLTTAAADFIVLPSRFEPCGLEDFIAQMYGTIPVAHATGGLRKIVDGQTGFLYRENTGHQLFSMLDNLVGMMVENPGRLRDMGVFSARYISRNYDWPHVIQDKYLPLYGNLSFSCDKKQY